MRATNPAPDSEPIKIPDKLYFRIGEVSRVSGVKQHVLRYWESEFSAISPKKSGTGHRLYRRKDVELLLEIKRLLYEERFTIEGARKFLQQKSKRIPAQAAASSTQTQLFGTPDKALDEIRRELEQILELLS